MKYRWYIVQVYSGSENRVAQLIREQSARKGLENCFEEIIVPTEEVVEIKNGAKVNVDRKYLPGYVFVKMIMNDESWHLVRSIPRVSAFLGVKGKPSPVTDSEVKRILEQVKESAENPRSDLIFEVGDNVKVNDGPFASFTGYVEEVEEDKQRLKVSVMVFGRPTPIALEYVQVEKI
jgi:transcriptional antiterminator NusG